MTKSDEILLTRYQRAEQIVSQLHVGGIASDGYFHLIIDIQEKIAEADEAYRKATDKSDVGGVYPKEMQAQIEREKQQQKEEEEEWGKLNLDGVAEKGKIEEAT